MRRTAAGVQLALAREFKAWLFEIQPFSPPPPLTSDGVAYYSGTRVRLDGSEEYGPHEPADVTLFDPIARDQPQRQFSAGDWVLATFNADSGRWEIVRDPAGQSAIVRFRLDATLSLGGTAAATIRVWDGDSYEDGDEITVEDWSTPGRFSAVNGAEGVAVKLADKDEYVILWVEHQAIFATATLTANMTGGAAACTFTDTWQGPSGTGAASQVYDVDGRYAGLLAGDKVLACWDDVEAKYKICDGPQSATVRWAYATADWINGAGNTSRVVCEAATGKDGGSAGGPQFNVYLPRPSGSVDPNVRQGTVIAYMVAEDGNRVCVSGYLDACIGTIKIWSGSAASIKPGWQLCDGSNGTPDLREKFVLGAFGDSGGDEDFDGAGGHTTVGSSGGSNEHLVSFIHTRLGSSSLRTNNVEQSIVQTASFQTEKEDPPLSVEGSGAYTDYALADVRVIDPLTDDTYHPDHRHQEYFSEGSINVETGGTPALEDCTGTQKDAACEEDIAFEHVTVEPGQTVGGYTHPVDPGGGNDGHRHGLSAINVELVWDTPPYDGHYHQVLSGTLDGKLAIHDVTHNSPSGVPVNQHYHDFTLDNHLGTFNHIPPYYALCYIMRVN